jgi:hypothetical protein
VFVQGALKVYFVRSLHWKLRMAPFGLSRHI